MVLLRPALRSTASPQTVLRRTIDPSPSSALSGAEHRPPGLLGALACGWVGALLGFAVGLFLREDYRLTRPRRLGRAGHGRPHAEGAVAGWRE